MLLISTRFHTAGALGKQIVGDWFYINFKLVDIISGREGYVPCKNTLIVFLLLLIIMQKNKRLSDPLVVNLPNSLK